MMRQPRRIKMENTWRGTINMKVYFTNIKFIIILSMITSGSFGSDQLNEVIAEEEGNISYRNSIDFDTKTTQVWWDSAWHK